MNINDKKTLIVEMLKDYLQDKTAIVGLSGGIDSAVVACLCVEASGAYRVVGVSLPYDKQYITDAEKVADKLGIDYRCWDIQPAIDKIVLPLNRTRMMVGNIMARIRMVYLYALSNELNGIVVGTTNRSEAEIGYYTKYGDGGVDIEPIADLWKREVYELGALLDIPKTILEKTPSAGFWEGQTDEEEFGFTYNDIERHVEGLTYNAKVAERSKLNEHKKHMPPAFKLLKKEVSPFPHDRP